MKTGVGHFTTSCAVNSSWHNCVGDQLMQVAEAVSRNWEGDQNSRSTRCGAFPVRAKAQVRQADRGTGARFGPAAARRALVNAGAAKMNNEIRRFIDRRCAEFDTSAQ